MRAEVTLARRSNPVLSVFDAATGRQLNVWRPPGASAGPGQEANWYVQPVACASGRSGCTLMKVAATAEVITVVEAARGFAGIKPAVWRLGLRGEIAPEPGADSDVLKTVGDVRIEQMLNGFVWAYSRSTGQRLWTSDKAGTLVGADHAGVYLVARDYKLVVLDVQTGKATSTTQLRAKPVEQWTFQLVYVHSGYVVIERLDLAGKETDPDERYYAGAVPVLLVAV